MDVKASRFNWYRDLKENGSYFDNQDRFQLVPIDHIVSKLSHREYFESPGVNTINKEIAQLGPIEEVEFSGGEPFLYNEFPKLLNNFDCASYISFYTGLGVDTNRLKKQINQIKQRENLQIYVSAETCGKLYEFNRYGNSYEIFLTNLKLLIDAGFSIKFNSVISNLTVLGFVDFVNRFKDIPVKFQFCNDPNFLAVNVLDDNTKKKLINILNNSEINLCNEIISNKTHVISMRRFIKILLKLFKKDYDKKKSNSYKRSGGSSDYEQYSYAYNFSDL
jgi:molybdenum cofactor biosynthesis enzyme MoaA